MKYCSKCNQNKDLVEFNNNKTTKDGLQYYCRDCKAKYKYPQKLKEYYNTHKIIILAQTKVRQQIINREPYLKYQKEYHQKDYEENKDKILEYFRQHYKKHKIRIKKRCDRWRRNNLKRASVISQRYRARKLKADGFFTLEDIEKIYIIQNGKCFYCDKELHGKFEIDHKIPLSRGGSNWPDNLCCSCKNCNCSKNNKTVEEYISSQS